VFQHRQKGQWGAKSPDDEKIVAMAAQIEALNLKGNLKANKSLEDALNDDKKMWNKKNRGDETMQKEDKAWKKIPPKDGDEKSKKMCKHTFHWCEHHMAWCMHHPSECRLGNQRKEEQSPPLSPTLNSKPSLPAYRGGSMRTDGACQHAYGIC